MKPLTSTDILLIRIKGIFPFFIQLSVLQVIFTGIAAMGYLSWNVAVIPYAIIAAYYLAYFVFIGLAKLTIKLLKKYGNTNNQ